MSLKINPILNLANDSLIKPSSVVPICPSSADKLTKEPLLFRGKPKPKVMAFSSNC